MEDANEVAACAVETAGLFVGGSRQTDVLVHAAPKLGEGAVVHAARWVRAIARAPKELPCELVVGVAELISDQQYAERRAAVIVAQIAGRRVLRRRLLVLLELPLMLARSVTARRKVERTAMLVDRDQFFARQAEVDAGKRAGVPTEMAEKMKALERENRELRQANEILRKASAYFAQAELVLWNPWLLRQKGAAAQHRKLRGSGGGGVVRSLVSQDRGRV